MLNTYFPSGSQGFCSMPSKGCLHDQPLTKILGIESLMSFLGRHFTYNYYKSLLEELYTSCMIPVGESLGLVSPELCPSHLFPLLIFPCILSIKSKL